MCSCHYVDIYPKFMEVCKKHGVEVKQVNNIGTALKMLGQHLVNLNTNNDTWVDLSTKKFKSAPYLGIVEEGKKAK